MEAILYFSSGKPVRFVDISVMGESQSFESQGQDQGLGTVIQSLISKNSQQEKQNSGMLKSISCISPAANNYQ